MYKNWKPPIGSSRYLIPSRANISTLFNKAGREVQTRNFDCYIVALLLDWDADITDFVGQPDPVQYRDHRGKLCSGYPDFEAFRQDNSKQLHIVTSSEVQSGPNFRYFQLALDARCEEQNSQLVIHNETSLPGLTFRVNLISLRGFRAKSYAHSEVIEVINIVINSNSRASVGDITKLASDQLGASARVIHDTIGHMLWHHSISTDLNYLIYVDAWFRPEVQLTR